MIDYTPLGTELWNSFHEHCSHKNIKNIICKQADINDPNIVDSIGTYDIIYSSGVLYHCPNPIYTLTQYSNIADEHLIFDSTVLDGKIENQHGTLQLIKGILLFVPSLD